MRPSLALAALTLVLVASPYANADRLYYYSLTDLGTSDTLVKDASGDITGVTNAAGTLTYAFDKTPVVVTVGPTVRSFPMGLNEDTYVTTFQTQGGTYSVATNHDGWGDFRTVTGSFFGTVSDANIHGEMIGSTSGGQALGVMNIPGVGTVGYAGLPDIPIPSSDGNFWLRPGGYLDDLGRILATGTDGHKYLLTPTSLGSPQTVPEPSTLIVFGIIAAVLVRKGCRSQRV